MNAVSNLSEAELGQRRRIRRTALFFGLIAAAFYFGFIVMAVIRARS